MKPKEEKKILTIDEIEELKEKQKKHQKEWDEKIKEYKGEQKALETYSEHFTPDYNYYLSDYSPELLL